MTERERELPVLTQCAVMHFGNELFVELTAIATHQHDTHTHTHTHTNQPCLSLTSRYATCHSQSVSQSVSACAAAVEWQRKVTARPSHSPTYHSISIFIYTLYRALFRSVLSL